MITKSRLEYMWSMRSKGLPDETKNMLLKRTGRNGEAVCRDYIQAIAKLTHYQRSHPGVVFDSSFTYKDILNGLSKAEQFRLWFHTPCLARRYDDLSSKDKTDIFDNPDWVFTEKIKGVRAVIVVFNGETHIFSRNYSEDDCHVPDYSSKIMPKPIPGDGVIYCADTIMRLTDNIDISDDLRRCGVTETKTPIEQMCGLLSIEPADAIAIQKDVKAKFGKDLVEFVLISPLHFNGVQYIVKRLGDCLNAYDECCEYGRKLGFNMRPFRYLPYASRSEKEVFLSACLKSGLDGVVAHNKYGLYHTTEPRSKTSYIKIKREFSDSVKLGDTIDTFITGFKTNDTRITHLVCSIYVDINGKETPHIIATVPIDERTSKLVSVDGLDGYAPMYTPDSSKIVSLNFEYKHMVAELDGDGINNKRTLINPRLIRFRTDKLDCECVYTKEFILSHIRELDTDNIIKANV